jgi:hypothetical protein
VAIIAHQPIEPSAFDISSIARNTVSGSSSGPPIDRGRYICRSPAFASTSATRRGTRRICSPSSRAARTSAARFFAAVTTSTVGSTELQLAAISALPADAAKPGPPIDSNMAAEGHPLAPFSPRQDHMSFMAVV